MTVQDVVDRVLCAVLLVGVAILIGMIYGCGRGDYWQETRPPGIVSAVIETDDPMPICKRVAWGCYDRETGILWLQVKLAPALKRCVTRHEYRHAAGDDHPGFPENPLAIDCGDGTVFSVQQA